MDLIPDNEFGQRVRQRLEQDGVIWLTTVDQHGRPQTRPVWFLWTGQSFLIYSQPDAHKIDQIASNPNVSLNLNSDEQGGDVVVFNGQARVEQDYQEATEIEAYMEKYREGLERLNTDPDEFAEGYSAPILVTPTKLRGH